MVTLHVFTTLLAGCLLVAALADACISDLRALRIADRDSMAVAAAFVLCGLDGWPVQQLAWHVAAAAAVFAAGAALFALGVWGGGDVKLCAALALLTGFVGLPRFLFVMATVGGIVALAVLALRGRAAGGQVPYGLAIAAAGMDWLWRTLPVQLDL
ncbi:MAG: prepilin peptidase [Rhodospirillaceae bacterium]|nr:MAG: prepilin peptidase [Rhodospirillaceae bacterium]TNC98767.1 MAG: prepilin peptidase CpaA [Stygiobacter sp.]